MPTTTQKQKALDALADRLAENPDLLERLAPADADEPAAPPEPQATVTAYVVLSNRDGADVCGPYKRKSIAEREQKRLNHEARDLAPGHINDETIDTNDVAKPNTYRVESVEVAEGVELS